MSKILTVQCGDTINRWLNTRHTVVSIRCAEKINKCPEHLDFLEGIDCVVFGGGMDIDPMIYSQKPHPLTTIAQGDNDRDTQEIILYWEAVSRKIPVVGICRGSQLVATQQGADLFQHVTGHVAKHKIYTHNKQTFTATSTHHQMVDLRKPIKDGRVKLLAWADGEADTKEYMSDKGVIVTHNHKIPEPEVFYFPEDDTLGIQGHPEFDGASPEYAAYCMNQIQNTIMLNRDKLAKEV